MNYNHIAYYDNHGRPITIREHIFSKEKKRLISRFGCVDESKAVAVYNSIPYHFYMEDTYNGYTYGCSPLEYLRKFFERNHEKIEANLK